MSIRASMTDIIRRVRNLINDKSGVDEVFSDDEVQEACDQRRSDIQFLELEQVESIAPGGIITYLKFYSPAGGNWETDVDLQDNGWNVLTPTTSDYLTGMWTFASQPDYPLVISGKQYNLYAIAADLLEQWVAKLKLEFDFSSDGQTFRRSQKIENMLKLVEHYRAKQSNGSGSLGGTARLVRDDTAY